ncbi:MAG: SUMF1/EgtB/PvdO family nonheme iron enzyme [Pseudomonadota bacterium]
MKYLRLGKGFAMLGDAINTAEYDNAALALSRVVVGFPKSAPINQLPPRDAMGLDGKTVRAFDGDLQNAARSISSLSPQDLAAVAEDPECAFIKRFAAGHILGLVGDPRIRPTDPPMVEVEGGRYAIGLSPKNVDAVVDRFTRHGVIRSWIEKETPRHAIELSTFRIGRYPVTNAEWADFVEDVGHEAAPSTWPFGVMPAGGGNIPVYTVAPEWADRYAAWLAAKTGRKFRLPTEAEWEAAAAGLGGRTFPWGDAFPPDHANTVESGLLAATPIGIFPRGATPEGVLDLAGNVEEYVADDYVPYPDGPHIDDNLNQGGSGYRVARGGSFTRYHDLARCKRRHGWFKTDLYAMGFRLAETP